MEGKKEKQMFFWCKTNPIFPVCVCVCVFFFYRSEWKIGQRGQDLSGLGAVG